MFDRPIHEQFHGQEAESSRKAHAGQAGEQETHRQQRRVVVEAVKLRQRQAAVTGLHGSQRQAESRQRQADRQPYAQPSGQAQGRYRLQPDQHQSRMAQEDVAEEAADLCLHQGHAGRVDRRNQRNESDAVQHPTGGDGQHQSVRPRRHRGSG